MHMFMRKKSESGFILVEALIGTFLLLTIITCFSFIIAQGVKWVHMIHHRHELLLDSRFSRIQVMNRIRYSKVPVVVKENRLEVQSPTHWRLGVYRASLVTILSNGVKQDITEKEISPSFGTIWVYPGKEGAFWTDQSGMIYMNWYTIVRPYTHHLHTIMTDTAKNEYYVYTGVIPYATYFSRK